MQTMSCQEYKILPLNYKEHAVVPVHGNTTSMICALANAVLLNETADFFLKKLQAAKPLSYFNIMNLLKDEQAKCKKCGKQDDMVYIVYKYLLTSSVPL